MHNTPNCRNHKANTNCRMTKIASPITGRNCWTQANGQGNTANGAFGQNVT
jgi:hypothetical protein